MADRADIVIGANFGDEGKGLVTDYLASKGGADTLVVRHNGGAQAGHTVTTPEGFRHVFKHFGSGSFVGASTYLSRFFACNPIIFFQELDVLKRYVLDPLVYADPYAPVSTPYDMMLNQMAEEHRGKGRHGSCGVGFGETIERNQKPDYNLFVSDLKDRDVLALKLKRIRSQWVPARAAALGVSTISKIWMDRLYSDDILDWYLAHSKNFINRVQLSSVKIITDSKNVVFEGAQGLLLDQDHGWFPHVTRSHTGIKNAVFLAHRAGIENIDVTYITRAYNTRHGAGPLPHELEEKPFAGIYDPTNIHNQYQGALRFGWLDLDILATSIFRDLQYAPFDMNVNHRLAVTCVDQIEGEMTFVKNGRKMAGNMDAFLCEAAKMTRSKEVLVSRGPTRATMSSLLQKDERIYRDYCIAT